MRIALKLILGFLLAIIIVGTTGFIIININQKSLEETIGEQKIFYATETIEKIDKNIYNRIEILKLYSTNLILQNALKESNKEFEKLDDIQDYINEKEKEWTSVPKETITPFMQQILDNQLSNRLKVRYEFYEEEYGYPIFGEILVTNKYGANLAQTGKTTNYRQDDEEWWKKAKEDGFYIGPVVYDESADIYSIDLCVRIDDENGNFLGILIAVLDIRRVIQILKEIEKNLYDEGNKDVELKLITKEGKLIYSTKGEFEFFYDMRSFLESHFKTCKRYFEGNTLECLERVQLEITDDKVFVHTHSKSDHDYGGLGWIFVLEQDAGEVFAPINHLRNSLWIAIFIMIVSIIMSGALISRYISKPITKLRNIANNMGKGQLDVKIDIKSKDEIGELASTLKRMGSELKKFHAGLEKQVKERTAELKKKTEDLEKVNKELNNTKLATLNILEDVKEANERLKEIDKLKTDFLNTTSHELKTPLTPIRSYLDLLEDGSLGKLNQQQKSALKVIDKNVKRLKRLISDILDITKVEAGQMKFIMEKIRFEKVIKEAIQEIKPSIDEKKIKIEVRIPKKLPLIEGDKQRLIQVLTNLLDNAIKFSPKNKRVMITAKKRKNSLFMAVADKGIGISKNNLPKLFTKFFQVDTSATREQPGTGLGLTICKGIIEAHNGNIWAESILGKGSTFYFTLPLKQTIKGIVKKESHKKEKIS